MRELFWDLLCHAFACFSILFLKIHVSSNMFAESSFCFKLESHAQEACLDTSFHSFCYCHACQCVPEALGLRIDRMLMLSVMHHA